MELSSKNVFNRELPVEYLNFLKHNPNGSEFDDGGRYWNIMGEKELLEVWEMNGVGKSTNFECLKLYIKVQQESSYDDWTESNVGKVSLSRIASSFVIGDENGDYLYLDPSDNFSVWIYYHDGGDVKKIAKSFEELIKS